MKAAARKLCEIILTNGLLRRKLPRVLKKVPLALADRQEKARILSSDPSKLPTLWESIRDSGRQIGHLRCRSGELSNHRDSG